MAMINPAIWYPGVLCVTHLHCTSYGMTQEDEINGSHTCRYSLQIAYLSLIDNRKSTNTYKVLNSSKYKTDAVNKDKHV